MWEMWRPPTHTARRPAGRSWWPPVSVPGPSSPAIWVGSVPDSRTRPQLRPSDLTCRCLSPGRLRQPCNKGVVLVCGSLALGRASGHREWVGRRERGAFVGPPPTPWGARRVTLAHRGRLCRAGGPCPPSGGVLHAGPAGPHGSCLAAPELARRPPRGAGCFVPQAGTCPASAEVRSSANHSSRPCGVSQPRKQPTDEGGALGLCSVPPYSQPQGFSLQHLAPWAFWGDLALALPALLGVPRYSGVASAPAQLCLLLQKSVC